MMSKRAFLRCQQRYAELLVTKAVGLLPGQLLIIAGESLHEPFAKLVAAAAYRHGARYVDWVVSNPWLRKLHLESSEVANCGYVPPHQALTLNQLVKLGGAVLSLRGAEDPGIFEGIDPAKLQALASGKWEACGAFYSKGINGKVHWSIGCVPTPGWAKRIFPKMNPEKAQLSLWEAIFKITGTDKPSYLADWELRDQTLRTRAEKLTGLGIKWLDFVGAGSNLRVGLSPKAVWLGGSMPSELAKGLRTSPNEPTFEVFTTPDLRLTEGVLRATTPVRINGVLVEGLRVRFKRGKVIKFSARKGRSAFAAMISQDRGAKFLGEVALVGTDSPIFESGLIFEETLLDENQACHVAFGKAYTRAVKRGNSLSKTDLKELGVNISAVHHDVMFSNVQTDVTAVTYDGKRVALIREGRWVI